MRRHAPRTVTSAPRAPRPAHHDYSAPCAGAPDAVGVTTHIDVNRGSSEGSE
jgi:hypothetical protein